MVTQKGWVALCTSITGEISDVVYDGIGLEIEPQQQSTLLSLFKDEYFQQAFAFVSSISQQQTIQDSDLELTPTHMGVEPGILHLYGWKKDDTLYFLGLLDKSTIFVIHSELNEVSHPLIPEFKLGLQKILSSYDQAKIEENIYNDLTMLNNELITVQRELTKKNIDLERMNEFKNRFLGMTVHDLRNPLMIVHKYNEIMLKELSPLLNKEYQEMIAAIYNSTDYMITMVNDLLEYTKLDSEKTILNLQSSSIVEIIKRSVSLNRIIAKQKEIDLVFSYKAHFNQVVLDSAKIEQVINNLISNAIKFSYPGSTIQVMLDKQQQNILLSVEDQGIGINESDQTKLFTPFKSFHETGTAGESCTGLGLAIVHRIVTAHGGKIWFKSQLNQGTTFYVLLKTDLSLPEQPDQPVVSPQATPSQPKADSVPTPNMPLRILIADDYELNRRLLQKLLAPKNYYIQTAVHGEDALEKLRHNSFDVLLVDIEMPKLSGLEVARIIRSGEHPDLDANIPIIAITGHESEDELNDMKASGIDAVYIKPFDQEKLFTLLEEGLAKRLESDTETQSNTNTVINPPVDVEHALERRTGDKEFLMELWEIFIQDTQQKLKQIQQAFDEQQYDTIKNIAHSMKSGSSIIGALRLAKIAAQLEALAKKNEYTMIESKYYEFIAESTRVMEYIEQNLLTDRKI